MAAAAASVQVRITPGENECEDTVFKFLQESFFLDEPLNAVLKRMPKKEDFSPLLCLKSGYSLVAYVKNVDSEERLAGVVLNKVKRRDEVYVRQPRTLSDDIIFGIIGKLEEKSDIWSRITSDELFYTLILTVGREFRGLQIAQKLMEESLKKATAAGFTHAAVECTSLYSARIMEKLNYERIAEIRYENYRNESGELLVTVENPHEAIIKYLKKL